ncbi:glycoside hydrolase family 3 N-terminal domain-containing protein [Gracilimonas sp. Q87]|uniref:glycoside hydrolase family 3 N-terminal domain-containing protein n=1 Tax=Gracilimonas sp. Q87 TaxID=3384766 RepID=UPI003983E63A
MQYDFSSTPSSDLFDKILLITFILGFIFILSTKIPLSAQPYKDPSFSLDDRIEDLISRMTLEEKVGQMTQLDITMVNNMGDQSDVSLDSEKARTLLQEHHIGSFLNGEAVPAQQWLEYITELQRIAVEETRLGIPIIYGIDHMHGASYLSRSTIFPHNINIGATFNTDNARQNGKITALEAGPLGHVWNFAPVLDLGRNPYWPRVYETYGEDPYLASELGVAYVNGLQAKYEQFPYQIAATGKHFLGYSVPRSGWDRTPVDLSMQTIHEFHKPSFQAALDAGMKTIMLNSGEVNGIPVHASKELLTDLLRKKMGFDGVILTDWADIQKLYDYHRTARDYDEATFQAIDAGVDMSMTPDSLNFNESLIKLVQNGNITENRINESVRRILKLKYELGLFEHPYPSGEGIENIGSSTHKAIALRSAQESMVLLKNKDNTLPLSKDIKNILVVGPSANSKRNLSGGWTLAWQGGSEEQYPESAKTITEAIQDQFPSSEVTSLDSMGEPGTRTRSDFDKAANEADVFIVAAGEEPYTEFVGNITDLELPKEQLDLIKTVNTFGKPTILVLIEGRPRVISEIVDDTDAIIWAGLPGFEGAKAIADVISGDVNPSGKLPFSYPQYVGYFVPYNHKPSASYHFDSEVANNIEQDDETIVEWEFGHGLSYTEFSYDNLTLSKAKISENESIEVQVTIKNTGRRTGTEAVLWFVSDEVGKISRPVKELIHFERVELKPGASRKVSLSIDPKEDLTYPDFDGNPVLEEGYFKIRVGDKVKRFYLDLAGKKQS